VPLMFERRTDNDDSKEPENPVPVDHVHDKERSPYQVIGGGDTCK